ncbi:MAG: translocation/assembly module TamB domain-containing protein [bacterium]
MTRRNFIALVSLCVFVALGAIVVGLGLYVTQSEYGQSEIRKAIESRVASSINGKLHIGRIGGNFLTGVSIDSVEIRDEEDSLFVAIGRVSLRYDPRDLVDRRLFFRSVVLDHPTIVLRQHENWKWNYRKIFKLGGPSKKKGPEHGFGDFVVLDSVHVRNGGSFRLTFPWHTDDSLRGAKKDSAIRINIARKDHEIRRTREGLTQTYRWTKAYLFLPHVRVADPDSAGVRVVIDTLHVDESTPPFKWKNVAGIVRILGDSAWFTSSHLDLPASTGRAQGKVVWGSDLPVRYAVHVTADSISLSDIDWVYPTLPRTGSGKMKLDIVNERELTRLDYAIHDMDVQSTKSRLRGQMTFETGGPVLNVHDVKLVADPVDFDLLRTLNGKPFPADWQGTLRGTVAARGGPLTHFVVDASDLHFADAHVRGATAHIQGRGELDILYPAFTAFHNFFATTDHFDLRTLVAIYPAFPRMTGIISGNAVLDSSWLDVRVSKADLTHTDGPSEPTHATGGGRITYGVQFMNYDLALQASPLSLNSLSLSYPKLPLRGLFSGPIHVRGIAPDLDVQADLTGLTGHITYAGKVDADSLGGYGAKGSGTFEGLDAAGLFARTKPPSSLAGAYDVDLLGDSLSNLLGSVAVKLGNSSADGLRISDGNARLRFDHGILVVDTARVNGVSGAIAAKGAIGLTRDAGADSLMIDVDVDSLGGLRRYLGRALNPDGKPAVDSLVGNLAARTVTRGWLDSLDVTGSIAGRGLYVRGDRARELAGTLALHQVRGAMTGQLDFHADTVVAAGIHVESAALTASIQDVGHARVGVSARTETGTQLRSAGDWRSHGDTTEIRLDTLNLAIATSRWALRRPSLFTQSLTGTTLDTLLFADEHGARISGFAQAPYDAQTNVRLRADSVPLGDIGLFAQLPSALAGRLSLDLNVRGTRDRPRMALSATAHELKYAGISAELATVDGGYDAQRANLQANVLRGGRNLLTATVSYPVLLTLFSERTADDSIRGRIFADSVDLALVEALSPKLHNTTGRLGLDLVLTGRPDDPHIGGTATVRDGAVEIPDVGLKFGAINGELDVDAAHDSLSLSQLHWTSPASNGSGSLSGSIVFRDLTVPKLDLRLDARALRAVDKRGLARLDVSTGATGLTLVGTPESATLAGAVTVDRGTIFIPELVRKQLVDITPDDFAQLFDTTDVRNRSIMPQPPGALVEHLELKGVSVKLGEDVWLRSREANIKLGGSLNVTRARDDRESSRSTLTRDSRGDSARYKLALSGTLNADRGTYTLDLTAVQREFQVQNGGRITFFGTPDFNPEIDVTAVYQVKQPSRADIGIKARIHGPFYPQPALDLSSSDAYLSPSDLVSYLLTGRPSFELDNSNTPAAQRALEFVLPSAGAYVSRVLRDQLGGFVDLFQIQSGAASDPLSTSSTTSSQFRSFLSSTRIGGEKQISDRLFLSFSTGLSAFCEQSSGQSAGFVDAIEGKLEYRFPLAAPDRLALRAGLDPAASALRCGKSVRGFAPTPQQVGFSLFRSWVF